MYSNDNHVCKMQKKVDLFQEIALRACEREVGDEITL